VSAIDDIRWYHLDGTECVAGWFAEGPNTGRCSEGGGPVTPCPEPLEQVGWADGSVPGEPIVVPMTFQPRVPVWKPIYRLTETE
jgi:hypothetical protein